MKKLQSMINSRLVQLNKANSEGTSLSLDELVLMDLPIYSLSSSVSTALDKLVELTLSGELPERLRFTLPVIGEYSESTNIVENFRMRDYSIGGYVEAKKLNSSTVKLNFHIYDKNPYNNSTVINPYTNKEYEKGDILYASDPLLYKCMGWIKTSRSWSKLGVVSDSGLVTRVNKLTGSPTSGSIGTIYYADKGLFDNSGQQLDGPGVYVAMSTNSGVYNYSRMSFSEEDLLKYKNSIRSLFDDKIEEVDQVVTRHQSTLQSQVNQFVKDLTVKVDSTISEVTSLVDTKLNQLEDSSSLVEDTVSRLNTILNDPESIRGPRGFDAFEVWRSSTNNDSATIQDWINHLKGPKGDTGEGIKIINALSSESELPSSKKVGDTYIINDSLAIWNGSRWVISRLVGPQGPQGPQGPAGQNGSSMIIKSKLSSTSQLPSSSRAKVNELYIVNGNLYQFYNNQWNNIGAIASQGRSAYEEWKLSTNKPSATVKEFLDSLVGNGLSIKSSYDKVSDIPSNSRVGDVFLIHNMLHIYLGNGKTRIINMSEVDWISRSFDHDSYSNPGEMDISYSYSRPDNIEESYTNFLYDSINSMEENLVQRLSNTNNSQSSISYIDSSSSVYQRLVDILTPIDRMDPESVNSSTISSLKSSLSTLQTDNNLKSIIQIKYTSGDSMYDTCINLYSNYIKTLVIVSNDSVSVTFIDFESSKLYNVSLPSTELVTESTSNLEVIDNLNSSDSRKPLSANQGKILMNSINDLKKNLIRKLLNAIFTNYEYLVLTTLNESSDYNINMFSDLVDGEVTVSKLINKNFGTNLDPSNRSDLVSILNSESSIDILSKRATIVRSKAPSTPTDEVVIPVLLILINSLTHNELNNVHVIAILKSIISETTRYYDGDTYYILKNSVINNYIRYTGTVDFILSLSSSGLLSNYRFTLPFYDALLDAIMQNYMIDHGTKIKLYQQLLLSIHDSRDFNIKDDPESSIKSSMVIRTLILILQNWDSTSTRYSNNSSYHLNYGNIINNIVNALQSTFRDFIDQMIGFIAGSVSGILNIYNININIASKYIHDSYSRLMVLIILLFKIKKYNDQELSQIIQSLVTEKIIMSMPYEGVNLVSKILDFISTSYHTTQILQEVYTDRDFISYLVSYLKYEFETSINLPKTSPNVVDKYIESTYKVIGRMLSNNDALSQNLINELCSSGALYTLLSSSRVNFKDFMKPLLSNEEVFKAILKSEYCKTTTNGNNLSDGCMIIIGVDQSVNGLMLDNSTPTHSTELNFSHHSSNSVTATGKLGVVVKSTPNFTSYFTMINNYRSGKEVYYLKIKE